MDNNYFSKDRSALQYHNMIYEKSKEAVSLYYRKNVQDWVGDVIAAFLSAVVLSLYLYWRYGTEFDVIGVLLSIIVGVVGVLGFRFFYNLFWEIPAKKFRDEEVKANKFTWNDVSISVLIDVPSNHSVPTCLDVINNKMWNIKNATVKVTDVKEGHVSLMGINEKCPVFLSWVCERGNEFTPKTLNKYRDGDDRSLLQIADWLEPDRVFLLATTKEKFETGKAEFIELKKGISYSLQLEWEGEVECRKIDKLYKWYSIKYENDKIYADEIEW